MTFDPNARPAPDQPSYAALLRQLQEAQNENAQLKRTKKFGLVWEDKPDAQVERVFLEAPLLCEDREKAVVTDEDAVNHVLINGDNFHALTALRATHTGKVDVIYIDPPYNTGNKDFIYNDDYVDSEDGYRHSKWLSFMEKRLRLAKELLSDTGVIFVSIDDKEQARLKLLMDEVFGIHNFIANIIWNGGKKNNSRFVSVGHDYILTYVQNASLLIHSDTYWRVPKEGYEEALAEASRVFALEVSHAEKEAAFKKYLRSQMKAGRIGDSIARYSFLDHVTGEPFNPDRDLSAPGGNGSRYELLHPATNQPCAIPSRGWAWSEGKMAAEIEQGNVFFGPSEAKIPRGKRFLSEMAEEVFGSVFYQERSAGSEQLKSIIGPNLFSFPKEVNSLKGLFSLVEKPHSTPVILDFFAGSGTTAHAVAELNKADGGRRQCILVTDGGKTEETGHSGSNSNGNAVHIAEEITYERVRRVLTGQDWADGKEHEPLGGNLRYFNVHMENIQPYSERDEAAAFTPFTRSHASIATSTFTVVEEKQADTVYGLPIDYTILSAPVGEGEVKYVVAVQAHDYELAELGEWFAALPEDADVTLMGHWLQEVEWVKENSARIKLVDVMEQVSASRKHAKSLVYT